MNKNIITVIILAIGILSLLNRSLAQKAIDLVIPVEGTKMEGIEGAGNSPDRQGYILNLCPKLVAINDFRFGNSGRGASEYRYDWQVNTDVIAFSISTIEYDPFGNPLPRSSWVVPVDDAEPSGERRKYDEATGRTLAMLPRDPEYSKPISGHRYFSKFLGAATSADLLEHVNLLDVIPATKSIDAIKKFFGQEVPEAHDEPKEHEIYGRSTRFVVVTFISHVCYKKGGQIVVWDAPGSDKTTKKLPYFLKNEDLVISIKASNLGDVVLYAYGCGTHNISIQHAGLEQIKNDLKKDPPEP